MEAYPDLFQFCKDQPDLKPKQVLKVATGYLAAITLQEKGELEAAQRIIQAAQKGFSQNNKFS